MFCNVSSIQNKGKTLEHIVIHTAFLFLFILFSNKTYGLAPLLKKHPPINTRPEVIVIHPPALYLSRITTHRYIFFTYIPSSTLNPKLSMKDFTGSVNSVCNTFISFTFLSFIIIFKCEICILSHNRNFDSQSE